MEIAGEMDKVKEMSILMIYGRYCFVFIPLLRAYFIPHYALVLYLWYFSLIGQGLNILCTLIVHHKYLIPKICLNILFRFLDRGRLVVHHARCISDLFTRANFPVPQSRSYGC